MRLIRADERGLTLVELLLAVVTLAVALGALFTASSAMAGPGPWVSTAWGSSRRAGRLWTG